MDSQNNEERPQKKSSTRSPNQEDLDSLKGSKVKQSDETPLKASDNMADGVTEEECFESFLSGMEFGSMCIMDQLTRISNLVGNEENKEYCAELIALLNHQSNDDLHYYWTTYLIY